MRHNVTNIRFESVQPDEALVASYFTVITEIGLDHMGRYRDRFVPVGGGPLADRTPFRLDRLAFARDYVRSSGRDRLAHPSVEHVAEPGHACPGGGQSLRLGVVVLS